MKPEEFKAKKEKFEKRAKRQVTDEEFEKMLKRGRIIQLILYSFCLVVGLLFAVEWPGRWFEFLGQFSSYLGWVFVVFFLVSLIQLARSWRIR